MSYKIRNITILLSFLFLSLVLSGYMILYMYPKRITEAQLKLDLLQQRTSLLEQSSQEFQKVQEMIEKKEEQFTTIDKIVRKNISPADTYEYLVNIMQRIGFLKFDMKYTGAQSLGPSSYRVYEIKGEGAFDRIFELIWYLERGPEIYSVKNMRLRGVESGERQRDGSNFLIPFSIEIWSHYAAVSNAPESHSTLSDVRTARIGDPFQPILKRNLPPNTGGLLEVERATLQAIVSGKALLADHKGKMHSLQEGDRVYLGYLSNIDPVGSRVEFTLNKGGTARKFTIQLDFDN